jgi:hypothetical protein
MYLAECLIIAEVKIENADTSQIQLRNWVNIKLIILLEPLEKPPLLIILTITMLVKATRGKKRFFNLLFTSALPSKVESKHKFFVRRQC